MWLDWPLWFLLWLQHTLSNNHQETEKNKMFINYRSWKLHGILGLGGGEWGNAGQEFCFYWGPEWGPKVSGAHSWLVNFKYKQGNLKCGKRKNTSSSNCQLVKLTKISKKQRRLVGREVEAWLFIESVAGSVVIRDNHLWSGCLGNQSLNQVLVLGKEKPIVRAYNDLPLYSPVWKSCRLDSRYLLTKLTYRITYILTYTLPLTDALTLSSELKAAPPQPSPHTIYLDALITIHLSFYLHFWPLNNKGLNCAGSLIHRFFFLNKYIGNFFLDICDNLKKLGDELCSLKIF